ncbi:MAG: DUF2065 domain-containing protein [Alphaproteobacteria bacterium]
MSDLLKALALVLIIEGLPYAAFPKLAKDMMRQMIDLPDKHLKTVGFIITSIGIALLWAVK